MSNLNHALIVLGFSWDRVPLHQMPITLSMQEFQIFKIYTLGHISKLSV